MNFTAKGANYWMKVEVKELTAPSFSTINDEAMQAVPYARYADNGVPVGTIISFGAGSTKVPEGWLLCDGTEYDGTMAQYEQLYNVLENTWGGTGSTFNVPELRGYFLRGTDNGAGNDPEAAIRSALIPGGNIGDNVGSYQVDTIKTHEHAVTGSTVAAGNHSHSVNGYWGGGVTSSGSDGVIRNTDGSYAGAIGSTAAAGDHSHSVTGNTDNTGGQETRPKNAYVLYIIKY